MFGWYGLVLSMSSFFLIWGCLHNWGLLHILRYLPFDHLFRLSSLRMYSYLRSSLYRVCSSAQLMLNLEFSFVIHLKIEIHMFAPNTELFLSNIREPRHEFFKYPILHQLQSQLLVPRLKSGLWTYDWSLTIVWHMLSQ